MKLTRVLFVFLLFSGRLLWAASWGVGILFNAPEEPELFQKDIDTNILEIARTAPSENYRLAIHREFQSRQVSYFPDPLSSELHDWSPLFFKAPEPRISVPGPLEVRNASEALLQTQAPLRQFLERSFEGAENRLLVLYAHGFAFNGIKGLSLQRLKMQLREALPERTGRKPLDILWLDACFMGSLEAVYELREFADYIIASEDAEFSAASPFESLAILEEGPQSTEAVALELGRRFVESYSYLRQGSQRRSVLKSSATLSVIETAPLEELVDALADVAEALSKLPAERREKLSKSLRRFRMEKPELIDLGCLLKTLSLIPELKPVKARLEELLQVLELRSREKTHTNARIRVEAPEPDSTLVFGFDDWTRGHEDDAPVLAHLPANLKPVGFVPGPLGKRWPTRNVHVRLYLTPFSVSLKRFHFYFQQPRTGVPLGPVQTYERTEDMAEYRRRNSKNPILYNGYTQGSGKDAERYTGLNVADPTGDFPSIEYLDTAFFERTGWLN